ncbi:hypothetical protein GGR53DRAFT_507130 [Hypoxylon sp. FL1150]|nr:hypothetical protein GGR53DRAFT_507130 [Hypoxylon sp. FL1150]
MLLKLFPFALLAPVAIGLPADQSYPTSLTKTKGTSTILTTQTSEPHAWSTTKTIFPSGHDSVSKVITKKREANAAPSEELLTVTPLLCRDGSTSCPITIAEDLPTMTPLPLTSYQPKRDVASEEFLTVTPLSCRDGSTSCPFTLSEDLPTATPLPLTSMSWDFNVSREETMTIDCPGGDEPCQLDWTWNKRAAVPTQCPDGSTSCRVENDQPTAAPTQCPDGSTSCHVAVHDDKRAAVPTQCPDGSTSCRVDNDQPSATPTQCLDGSKSCRVDFKKIQRAAAPTQCPDGSTSCHVAVKNDESAATPTLCPDGSNSCRLPARDAHKRDSIAPTANLTATFRPSTPSTLVILPRV